MKQEPEPCPTCGARAVERKTCRVCGEPEWVISHDGHYKWGLEVVRCSCHGDPKSPGYKAAALRKKHKRRLRDTGTVPRAQVKGTPEMVKKAAELLKEGLPALRALQQAGYSKHLASKGVQGINRAIRNELKKIGGHYVRLGKDLTPEDQENLVRGRLAENVIQGTDKGVLSAKQLGADKRVAMWQPDSQVGLVVLQAPQVRKIMHEVPLLPPEPEEQDDAV